MASNAILECYFSQEDNFSINSFFASVAELVDALVSKTSGQ